MFIFTLLRASVTVEAISIALSRVVLIMLPIPFTNPCPVYTPIFSITRDGEWIPRKPLTAFNALLAMFAAAFTAELTIEPIPLMNPRTKLTPALTICPANPVIREIIELPIEPILPTTEPIMEPIPLIKFRIKFAPPDNICPKKLAILLTT